MQSHTPHGHTSNGRTPASPYSSKGWKDPTFREVSALIYKQMWNDQDALRLKVSSIIALSLAISAVYSLDHKLEFYIKPISPYPEHIRFIISIIKSCLCLFLVINYIQLYFKYRAPPPNISNFALTPAQKLLLGLDPNTPSKPGNDFKNRNISNNKYNNLSDTPSQKSHTNPTSPFTFKELQSGVPGHLMSGDDNLFLKRYKFNYPKLMTEEPIRDRKSLRILENMPFQSELNKNSDMPTISWQASNQIAPIPVYQQARQPIRDINVDETVEDGIIRKDAQKTREEWNIDAYLDEWVEKMREWISKTVIEMYAKRITEVDAKLEEKGLGHLTCKNATWAAVMEATQSQLLHNSTAMFSNFGQISSNSIKPLSVAPTSSPESIQTLVDLVRLFPNNEIVKERFALETVLNVQGYSCREYIVDRINELAARQDLGDFIWDGGSEFQGKSWSREYLPTDSQLIMHLFCHYMNDKIPSDSVGPTFTSRYFVGLTDKIDRNGEIQIRQASKNPPHYQIIVENIVYDCDRGRNNVFIVLCLFAQYILHQNSGHIGVLNSTGQSINFVGPVKNGPKTGKYTMYQRVNRNLNVNNNNNNYQHQNQSNY